MQPYAVHSRPFERSVFTSANGLTTASNVFVPMISLNPNARPGQTLMIDFVTNLYLTTNNNEVTFQTLIDGVMVTQSVYGEQISNRPDTITRVWQAVVAPGGTGLVEIEWLVNLAGNVESFVTALRVCVLNQ